MISCWAQQPRDRPSASQIVSIASAPEFTHLLDVVSLQNNAAVLCAGVTVLPAEEEGWFLFPFFLSQCWVLEPTWLLFPEWLCLKAAIESHFNERAHLIPVTFRLFTPSFVLQKQTASFG